MNENLDLVVNLKDCPKGTKLYSTIYSDNEKAKHLVGIDMDCPEYYKWWER